MKIAVYAAVAAIFAFGASHAIAGDITYTGSALINGFNATYSITTDGALGNLQDDDILAASLTLTDPNGAPETRSGSYGFSNFGNILDFTPQQVLIQNSGSDILSGLDYPLNFSLFLGDNEETIRTPDNFTSGPVPSVFATAISAAPEPGGWALMFAGVACLGAALRFRRREIASLAAA